MDLEGILCIDKPNEHTSFDVVARVRGILKTRKVGHGGTLDPMTTGVLPIFLGRATKACDILPVQDKGYRASFRLGMVTDTQDITGKVLFTHEVNVDRQLFADTIMSFVGEQMQMPPMFSAVRVNGQRLYDIAREGREIEREARPITFYQIDIIDITGDTATIDVNCSKGSYIRTLAHDIGQKLGCGAVLTELRRTMAAGFTLQNCLTLEQLIEIAAKGSIDDYLLPVAKAFDALPKINLSERRTQLYKNGVKLETARLGTQAQNDLYKGKDIAVYSHKDEFLGISYIEEDSGELKLRKLFSV